MNQRPLLALFAGCWLGEAILHIHWMMILITLFLLCVFLVTIRKHGFKKSVFLCLLGMLVGEAFTGVYLGKIEKQEQLYENEKNVSIVGKVQWKEETSSGYCFHVADNYDTKKERYINGDVLVYTKDEMKVSIGSYISYTGELESMKEATNLGEFSMKTYYNAKEIYFRIFPEQMKVLKEERQPWLFVMDQIKKQCYERNRKNYTGRVLEIVEAMTLGDKRELSPETKDLFQSSGLVHVLAISGLHVSLIGAGVFKRMRQMGIGFWPSFLCCMVLLMGYCQVTGNSVSAQRAAWMLGIYMFGQCLGKSYDILTSLSGASFILLLQCPERAMDSGFIYSVMAVIIIGVSQDILNKKTKGWREKAKNSALFCLILQMGMLPITCYFQYEFYLNAFLANFLLLPIISFGFMLAILSILIPIQGIILPCKFLFQFVLKVLEVLTSFDGFRVVTGHVLIPYVMMLYVILILLWKRKWKGLYAGLFIAMLWIPCFIPRNRISFLDVGQGDGIVMTCKNQSVLIDGGSSSKKNVGRYVLLPYLKYSRVKKLDYAILTHTDLDHDSGMLELLEMGYIKHLILGDVKEEEDYKEILQLAKKHGTEVSYQSKGDTMKGNGWEMKCLHPEYQSTLQKNAASQVYQLKLWNTSFLLTGDVEKEGESRLVEALEGPVDILKVAHHGSKYTTSNELLEKISPKVGIISAGENNRYGHPHKELINRLLQYKVQILDTRNQGMIWMEKGKKGVEIHVKKG